MTAEAIRFESAREKPDADRLALHLAAALVRATRDELRRLNASIEECDRRLAGPDPRKAEPS